MTMWVSFGDVTPMIPVSGSTGLLRGNSVRTEEVELPGTTIAEAAAGDSVVRVEASVECWIAIGPSPSAGPPSTGGTTSSIHLAAGMIGEFAVSEGDKVAGVAA